jgi:hypothetical protein
MMKMNLIEETRPFVEPASTHLMIMVAVLTTLLAGEIALLLTLALKK